MLKTLRLGVRKKKQEISILELSTDSDRKFILILDEDDKKDMSFTLTREELQKLNENIAQIITMEINNGK